MPKLDELVSSNDPESEEVKAAFRGKTWQSLSLDLLLSNREGLYLLTPEAYRYYFPAYMTVSLKYFETADLLPHTVIFSLTLKAEENEKIRNYTSLRLRAFSLKELLAIEKYIEFMQKEHKENFLESQLENALQSVRGSKMGQPRHNK
jgi:hypothetical protein